MYKRKETFDGFNRIDAETTRSIEAYFDIDTDILKNPINLSVKSRDKISRGCFSTAKKNIVYVLKVSM